MASEPLEQVDVVELRWRYENMRETARALRNEVDALVAERETRFRELVARNQRIELLEAALRQALALACAACDAIDDFAHVPAPRVAYEKLVELIAKLETLGAR